MDPENYKHKIEDLLYEESTRKILSQEHIKVSVNRRLYLKIAAVAASLLVLFFVFNHFSNSDNVTTAYSSFIEENYQFPTINESRGKENIALNNIKPLLKSGNYSAALAELEGKVLSEEARFIKAHLLFNLGSYDEAKALIQSSKWTEEFYQEETSWLAFLIGMRQEKSIGTLSTMADRLPQRYREIATQFLEPN